MSRKSRGTTFCDKINLLCGVFNTHTETLTLEILQLDFSKSLFKENHKLEYFSQLPGGND